ncbi:MAG: TonB-dependent receptor, partial [Proteobacteria bacterium]|nr:TonB-dependent receptor [Pseudomonadota bacterium]
MNPWGVSFRPATLPLAVSCALAGASSLAWAQADVTTVAQLNAVNLPDTVVTATRVAQPLSDVLADVTLIDRPRIEDSGAVTISDLLARQPGLELSRSGGPGTATGVFLRGAETRFTAVYIDGVRVDSQATGGAPWEAISL